VDAPSPLQVSDVMPLLGAVDGIVIVARVDHTRESSAARLMELLQRTPSAPVLGIAANAVRPRDLERYGFASGLSERPWPFKLIRR
jgi:Mrp family chromosome partitioning ATPase